MRHEAVLAETIGIRGANDDEIEAYTARPIDGGSRGGVVVIHDMPGYDWATKEIVRWSGLSITDRGGQQSPLAHDRQNWCESDRSVAFPPFLVIMLRRRSWERGSAA